MCSGWCGAELYVAGILSRLIPGCLLPHQPPHIPKTVGKTLSKQETPFRSPLLNQLACVHPNPFKCFCAAVMSLACPPRAAGGIASLPAPWPQPQVQSRSARCPAGSAQWAGPCHTPRQMQAAESRGRRKGRDEGFRAGVLAAATLQRKTVVLHAASSVQLLVHCTHHTSEASKDHNMLWSKKCCTALLTMNSRWLAMLPLAPVTATCSPHARTGCDQAHSACS